MVQGDDLFFDGVGGNQPVNRHRALLANPVNPVAGLVFHCRVPPGVQVNHIISLGQVQPGTPGFQANQEYLAFAALECLNPCLTGFGWRGTVQILERHALLGQPLPGQGQVVNKLAEHQRLVAVVQQLANNLGKRCQLAAGQRAIGQDQRGVAAKAAQAGDFCQHLNSLLLIILAQLGQRLLAQCFVQMLLVAGQRHLVQNFRAGRQLGQHLGLGPAQDKRLHQGFQRLAGLAVAIGNGGGKALVEALLAA